MPATPPSVSSEGETRAKENRCKDGDCDSPLDTVHGVISMGWRRTAKIDRETRLDLSAQLIVVSCGWQQETGLLN